MRKTVLDDSTANNAPEITVKSQDVSVFKKDTYIKMHNVELACKWVGGILVSIAVIGAFIVEYFG